MATTSKSTPSNDILAAERDAKFKVWLQNKTLRDKAFEYLGKLDKDRAKSEESCKQVAVSLCAIDRLLGEDGEVGANNENDADNMRGAVAPPKNDKSKSSAVKTVRSAWMKWTMEHHTFEMVKISIKDVQQLSKGALENFEESEDGAMIIPSLQFFYPEEPTKPGDKTKPLTSDQKVLNTFVLRELKKLWMSAKASLSSQVKDIVEGKAPSSSSKASFGAEAKGSDRTDGEKKSKSESAGAPIVARSDTPSATGSEGMSAARLEMKALTDLSLKRLREWIEEDEDKYSARQVEMQREKIAEAKKAHESYVKRVEEDAEARKADARRKARDDAEIKAAEAEKSAEHTKEAFEKWAIQKEIRESSLKCLSLLPPPQASSSSEKTVVTSSAARLSAAPETKVECNMQTLNSMHSTDALAMAMDVGRSLKKVDRTLLPDWARWCDKIIPFNTAAIFWDAFEPIACDVHSPVTSAVKDAFLKVLRPGVDYKATFREYARRRGGDMDRMDKEEKAQALAEIAVPKAKMLGLLEEMGLALKPTEFRTLIDSFDVNGDGRVTMGEFAEFCEGGRAALAGRCCWMTTCCRTGMANAYSVSEPTKKQARTAGQAESKQDESRSDAGSKAAGHADTGSELVVVRELPNGEKRIIVELKDRKRREDLLRRFEVISGDDAPGSPDGYANDFDDYEEHGASKGKTPKCRYPQADKGKESRCSFSLWSNDDRRKGLEHLYDASRSYRQEEMIRTMLSQGQAPKAPKLWVEARSSNQNASSELEICWEPAKGDLVSFFCVEYAGMTGLSKDAKYQEVYRDPTTADPNEQFYFGFKFPQDAERFGLKLDRLQPGTSHQFRIRAFNGFGPGDYTYKIFTTRTDAPPAPRIQKVSSDSVTLRWSFSETFFKRLQDLRKFFDRADEDKTGSVSRDELCRVLEERDSPSLKQFLDKKAGSLGIDISQGYGALFDQIDSDDGGGLGWNEFEEFFIGAGWADSKASVSMGFGASASNASLRNSAGVSSSRLSKQDISFVVEQCESEFDNVYKEVLRTSLGYGSISRLEAGKSYRFRVFSINIDGVPGPRSESIVVHTMLETPTAPACVNIDAKKITVSWKARAAQTSTRDPAAIQKMLADWAGTHGESEGGVSIETAFAKYDRNGSGDIDASELACMLEDLGVETSEERLREAFAVLDRNGDGIITFDEFALWWRRDEVAYVLKRSEPIHTPRTDVRASTASMTGSTTGSKLAVTRGNGQPSTARLGGIPEDRSVAGSLRRPNTQARAQVALPIVVYRGTQTKYQVLGLEPNRYYHFKLRYSGSRCNSMLSQTTAVMTAPLAPSAPLLIDVTSTTVRIKWYAPMGGAYKFVVQLRAKGTLGARRAAPQDPVPGGSDGWLVVFNGQDTVWTSTTMVPDSEYDVRILAVNCQGTHSEPSAPLNFSTLTRDSKQEGTGPRFADSIFTIECTADICVGDTVLITERLYAADRVQGDASVGGSQILPSSKSSSAKTGNPKGTVRMEMSVTSHGSGLLAPGTFIGERTMACNVVKDNYRTSRDALTEAGVTPSDSKRFGKARKLWMEVVWQRSSSDACKAYELKPGDVVERLQSNLEQFEVFRSPWKGDGEKMRKGLVEEWAGLSDCYVSVDTESL